MASELGLNGLHERQIGDFLRFSRKKRSQCLRTVETAFESACESRLSDETFTSEEVREVVAGISGVVQAEVEEELMASSHITAALLQQLFRKAEESYLNLPLNDITQLEKKETLESIAEYERQLSSGTGFLPHSLSQRSHLQPLQVVGREKLMQEEIDRLKAENRKLLERVQILETKASSALSEKKKLQSKLSDSHIAVESVAEKDREVSELREQLAALQLQLGSGQRERERATVQSDELLQVQAELERTKAELEKKFAETAQYKNMKTMLSSKTNLIKELRAKLKQYED